MQFEVSEELWQRFPGLRLVLVHCPNILPKKDGVKAILEQVCNDLSQHWSYPNAQSHPAIAAWRQAFKANGVSAKKFPSSIEALCRRVLTGKGLPSINPLVDFYNWVSLKHLVPAGGWDLDDIANEKISLGLSRGGEPFQALGSDQRMATPPGEVCYFEAREVITRHFVWRQSGRGKIETETKNLFLVSEILADRDDEVVEEIHKDLSVTITDFFEVEAITSTVLTTPATHWSTP